MPFSTFMKLFLSRIAIILFDYISETHNALKINDGVDISRHVMLRNCIIVQNIAYRALEVPSFYKDKLNAFLMRLLSHLILFLRT